MMASLNSDDQTLSKLQQQNLAQGEQIHAKLEKGKTFVKLLYEDPQTRLILENFAEMYYCSDTPIMMDKQVGEIAGGLIPGILLSMVTKDPGLLAEDAANATGDLAEVVNQCDQIAETITDLKETRLLENREVDQEHLIEDQRASTKTLPPDYVEEFKYGGSALMDAIHYKNYVERSETVGRNDGFFIASKEAIDQVIEESSGSMELIMSKLGVNNWTGNTLYRIDILNPLDYNPRLPDSSLSGANEKFVPGGETAGGIKEIVIDQIHKSNVKISKTNLKE